MVSDRWYRWTAVEKRICDRQRAQTASLHPCMKLMRILKKAITDTPHISIDMEQTQHSKTFNKIPATDIVISIGCDVGCLYSGISFDNNRKLQDPTGQSDAVFIDVIKQIEEHIRKL